MTLQGLVKNGDSYQMNKPQKMTLVILLAIGVVFAAYLFFGKAPPANPNEDRIAFVAKSSIPELSALFLIENIYVVNPDSPGLTHVIRQPNLQWGLTWSSQGDKIAYYEYGTDGLYAINADGSEKPELLWRGTRGRDAINLSWSPDGSKIAFSNSAAIHLLDLVTKEVNQLTDGSTPSVEPTWSPDSNQIAFVLVPFIKRGGGPDSSIGVINVDGSSFVQLTPNDKSRSPDWSPDGSRIVFEREGNIYVMNRDGTEVIALTQDGNSHLPTWSPDGTRIAFISTKNQKCGSAFADSLPFCTSELFVMDSDGSDVALIRSKQNENISWPVWAPRFQRQ